MPDTSDLPDVTIAPFDLVAHAAEAAALQTDALRTVAEVTGTGWPQSEGATYERHAAREGFRALAARRGDEARRVRVRHHGAGRLVVGHLGAAGARGGRGGGAAGRRVRGGAGSWWRLSGTVAGWAGGCCRRCATGWGCRACC
ncbi:hypothetical protein GCM10025868_07910 [Angustibacter aerolatus]|uniref:Uncharacterized protein n=1 Tax=Angustibacter aerolatus TaxID=1162965 RepID=A0ABQ6JBJ0_9ACTN|nr:hypothetical protein [Angustibacter aerolatus]GMA85541.1 hypothetical protein GCM10025868_07910 [Angustibacter aerolatus]